MCRVWFSFNHSVNPERFTFETHWLAGMWIDVFSWLVQPRHEVFCQSKNTVCAYILISSSTWGKKVFLALTSPSLVGIHCTIFRRLHFITGAQRFWLSFLLWDVVSLSTKLLNSLADCFCNCFSAATSIYGGVGFSFCKHGWDLEVHGLVSNSQKAERAAANNDL